MGNRCADHVTPLYPQKLALTSPTGGGRSVGIVRSRTKATESYLSLQEESKWKRILNALIEMHVQHLYYVMSRMLDGVVAVVTRL